MTPDDLNNVLDESFDPLAGLDEEAPLGGAPAGPEGPAEPPKKGPKKGAKKASKRADLSEKENMSREEKREARKSKRIRKKPTRSCGSRMPMTMMTTRPIA